MSPETGIDFASESALTLSTVAVHMGTKAKRFRIACGSNRAIKFHPRKHQIDIRGRTVSKLGELDES